MTAVRRKQLRQLSDVRRNPPRIVFGWRSCRPNARFVKLVRFSRTSIANEMLEQHRPCVLGK
jgi:hypothetical protein